MVAGIYYLLRVGGPWRDLPPCFGPWNSVYTRWRRWTAAGLWRRILQSLVRGATGQLRLLDCTHCKVHQHGLKPAGGQAAQAIGRTNGGLNTKIAAIVDMRGRPLAVALAPGQQHDTRAVQPVLAALWRRRLVADKAFDSAAFRAQVRRRQSRACIPPRRGRRAPARFHRGYYRARHHVENYFGRLKCYRRVATRYEKLAVTFLGFVELASVLLWLAPLV
jgi:transposase